jgi:hypothetical protein
MPSVTRPLLVCLTLLFSPSTNAVVTGGNPADPRTESEHPSTVQHPPEPGTLASFDIEEWRRFVESHMTLFQRLFMTVSPLVVSQEALTLEAQCTQPEIVEDAIDHCRGLPTLEAIACIHAAADLFVEEHCDEQCLPEGKDCQSFAAVFHQMFNLSTWRYEVPAALTETAGTLNVSERANRAASPSPDRSPSAG